jgi:hypothetical protein
MRSLPPVDGKIFEKSYDNVLHALREEKSRLKKEEAGNENLLLQFY